MSSAQENSEVDDAQPKKAGETVDRPMCGCLDINFKASSLFSRVSTMSRAGTLYKYYVAENALHIQSCSYTQSIDILSYQNHKEPSHTVSLNLYRGKRTAPTCGVNPMPGNNRCPLNSMQAKVLPTNTGTYQMTPTMTSIYPRVIVCIREKVVDIIGMDLIGLSHLIDNPKRTCSTHGCHEQVRSLSWRVRRRKLMRSCLLLYFSFWS